MDEEQLIDELRDLLDHNGEITLSNDNEDITIKSFDGNGDYLFISGNGKRFETSKDAIDWVALQFDGIENIDEWS